jgi:hypothetical protein
MPVLRFVTVSLVLLASSIVQAIAQELEEIAVTATRRAE